MITHDSLSRKLAVGISFLAGFIDALGYHSLGGVFVSFMSGNSTRFAVALGENVEWHSALLPLWLIALFVMGVMAGRVIRHFSLRMPSTCIMTFVTLTLTASAILHNLHVGYFFTVALLAIAMGATNNVFFRNGEVSIGLTYMTGTLVRFGQRLAGRLLGEKEDNWLPYLLLWLGLVSGAVLGAMGYATYGLNILWLGIIASYGLTMICFHMEKRLPAAKV